jgi:hypothetical protein
MIFTNSDGRRSDRSNPVVLVEYIERDPPNLIPDGYVCSIKKYDHVSNFSRETNVVEFSKTPPVIIACFGNEQNQILFMENDGGSSVVVQQPLQNVPVVVFDEDEGFPIEVKGGFVSGHVQPKIESSFPDRDIPQNKIQALQQSADIEKIKRFFSTLFCEFSDSMKKNKQNTNIKQLLSCIYTLSCFPYHSESVKEILYCKVQRFLRNCVSFGPTSNFFAMSDKYCYDVGGFLTFSVKYSKLFNSYFCERDLCLMDFDLETYVYICENIQNTEGGVGFVRDRASGKIDLSNKENARLYNDQRKRLENNYSNRRITRKNRANFVEIAQTIYGMLYRLEYEALKRGAGFGKIAEIFSKWFEQYTMSCLCDKKTRDTDSLEIDFWEVLSKVDKEERGYYSDFEALRKRMSLLPAKKKSKGRRRKNTSAKVNLNDSWIFRKAYAVDIHPSFPENFKRILKMFMNVKFEETECRQPKKKKRRKVGKEEEAKREKRKKRRKRERKRKKRRKKERKRKKRGTMKGGK